MGAAYQLYNEEFQPSVQALDALVEHKASLEALFNTLPPIKTITKDYLTRIGEARSNQLSLSVGKTSIKALKDLKCKDSQKTKVSATPNPLNSLFGEIIRDWGDAQHRKLLEYHKSTASASSLWAKELLSHSVEQAVRTDFKRRAGLRQANQNQKGPTMLQSELLEDMQIDRADDTDETKSESDDEDRADLSGASTRGRSTTQTMGGSYDFHEHGSTPGSCDKSLQHDPDSCSAAAVSDGEQGEEEKIKLKYAAAERIAFEAAELDLQNQNHPRRSALIAAAPAHFDDDGDNDESSISSDFTISSGGYESD